MLRNSGFRADEAAFFPQESVSVAPVSETGCAGAHGKTQTCSRGVETAVFASPFIKALSRGETVASCHVTRVVGESSAIGWQPPPVGVAGQRGAVRVARRLPPNPCGVKEI